MTDVRCAAAEAAAAGDGGENALGYSITGARRKCLYLHPIPVHCTPTYVTVCASVCADVCVRMMFSLKRGKYSFHMRCNFLAHFNYANCVYVETNSHCLPAHVCLFLSLSLCLLSLFLTVCVHYRIMQTKRRRWARRCAAKEMRISFSISNRHSHPHSHPHSLHQSASPSSFPSHPLPPSAFAFAWPSMLYMQLTWLATTNNPIVGKNQ